MTVPMLCGNCGAQNPEGRGCCVACGFELRLDESADAASLGLRYARVNGYAIASVVLGSFGIILHGFLLVLGTLTGVTGVVMGVVGYRQAKARPREFTGKGLAIVGVVLCLISMVACILEAYYWIEFY